MKRVLSLTAVVLMTMSAGQSFAQADADNFYKSDLVKTEKYPSSTNIK